MKRKELKKYILVIQNKSIKIELDKLYWLLLLFVVFFLFYSYVEWSWFKSLEGNYSLIEFNQGLADCNLKIIKSELNMVKNHLNSELDTLNSRLIYS